MAVLFIFLNLNPHHGRSFKTHVREFDFVGLGLIVSGVVCLLIGFNESERSCKYFLFGYEFEFNFLDFGFWSLC